MKRYTFLLTFFLFSGVLTSQKNTYFQKFYLAEKLYANEKTKSNSINIYRQAFACNKLPLISNLLNTFYKAYRMDSLDFCYEIMDILPKVGFGYQNLKKFLKGSIYYGYERINIIDSLVFLKNFVPEVVSDSLLLRDLEYMLERDQAIRKIMNPKGIYSMQSISDMNYLWLKKIIENNDGLLPSFKQVGGDGIDHIKTLIMHLDIEHIVELWPAFTRSIEVNCLPIGENIIYQIDRNMVNEPNLVYLKKDKLIIKKNKNKEISGRKIYYQNYGGMDFFNHVTKKTFWWPFNPDIDLKNTDKIRKALLLDSIEDLKLRNPHIVTISAEEFLEFIFKQG